MLHSADVGKAWRGLILTLHLNGRAVVPSLVVRDGMAILTISLYGDYVDGGEQVVDFSLATGFNVSRELCGPRWSPTEVQFAYRPPANQRPYKRFFKTNLRFESSRSALIFPASWLERRIAGANPETRKAVQLAIAGLVAHQNVDLLTKVRRTLFTLLAQDDVSIENVARMLGMHKRTLNRRLADLDTSFPKLLNDVRFQIARQLLSNTDMAFVDIAAALNYTDPSTFSRAFRSWAGTTPSRWRTAHPS